MTKPKLPRVGRDAATLRYVARELAAKSLRLAGLAETAGFNEHAVSACRGGAHQLSLEAKRFTREARAAALGRHE